MAFCWLADDGRTLSAGLVAVIFQGSGPVLLYETIYFGNFSGGGGGGSGLSVPPTGSVHDYIILGFKQCSFQILLIFVSPAKHGRHIGITSPSTL